MDSSDGYENVKMKYVKLFEPTCWRVNRKAANMKKSHFHPGIEEAKCRQGLWQHSNALLLFTVWTRAPGVHSEPQLCNYKQSSLVPECGLALTTPVSVSAHTLAFVVLRGSHLSSKVLLCGCCSVTCVSAPAGWPERHTSNHGDVMEEKHCESAAKTC